MVAKKDLTPIPWERIGVRLANAGRTVKMLKPVCPESAEGPGCETKQFGAWWIECEKKGHDPYHQVKEEIVKHPQVEMTEDGRQLITGYEEEVERFRTPRVTQVALTDRINSHQGVENGKFWHGYKYPEELGYSPMCEFRNCFADNPEIITRYGKYCREEEAKMVIADERHIVLEVYVPEKRREQIENIVVK